VYEDSDYTALSLPLMLKDCWNWSYKCFCPTVEPTMLLLLYM